MSQSIHQLDTIINFPYKNTDVPEHSNHLVIYLSKLLNSSRPFSPCQAYPCSLPRASRTSHVQFKQTAILIWLYVVLTEHAGVLRLSAMSQLHMIVPLLSMEVLTRPSAKSKLVSFKQLNITHVFSL